MQKLIHQQNRLLTAIHAFIEKYPRAIELNPFSHNVEESHNEKPDRYIFFCRSSDAALAGEVFGREGWTRKVNYQHYNWTRVFDFITITIYNAEEIPTADDTPVPPKSFPLMLNEPKASGLNQVPDWDAVVDAGMDSFG